MWIIEALDVLGLQGGGGEPFARFLNSLIRPKFLGRSDSILLIF